MFMSSEQKYVTSLESFLEHSSEDKVDVDGILAQLPAYTNHFPEYWQTKKSATLLDVGSGNGAKALYFAKVLSTMGVRLRIDSVEPKPEQQCLLEKNHALENNQYLGKIYDGTLAQAEFQDAYDFLFVIHSLYEFTRNDDGLIDSLEKIPSLLRKNGVAIIVVEHTNGDFQRMKRELYPRLGKPEPVSEAIIKQTLNVHHIDYQLGDLIEFRFPLPNLKDCSVIEIGKSVEFLFSDSLQNSHLSDSELTLIGKWIQEHARCDNGENYFWTPDAVFWINHTD
jgi:SAM-dependent methyltransferase